jgi:uncharacterized protein YijF (DUF1287 family)
MATRRLHSDVDSGVILKFKPIAALSSLAVAFLLISSCLGDAQDGTQPAAFLRNLVAAAVERTEHVVRYDPGYVRIPYPGGDVPPDTGVCTDEIIRAYRAVGVDLQKQVHEDMAANFGAYPSRAIWGLAAPDTNIDHRRVPNLRVFFARKGELLRTSNRADDYLPGDLVTWDLGHGLTHIGIVTDQKALLTRRYMIEHNIGAGPKIEDVLFDWKITGHYRYYGPERAPSRRRPSRRRP